MIGFSGLHGNFISQLVTNRNDILPENTNNKCLCGKIKSVFSTHQFIKTACFGGIGLLVAGAAILIGGAIAMMIPAIIAGAVIAITGVVISALAYYGLSKCESVDSVDNKTQLRKPVPNSKKVEGIKVEEGVGDKHPYEKLAKQFCDLRTKIAEADEALAENEEEAKKRRINSSLRSHYI